MTEQRERGGLWRRMILDLTGQHPQRRDHTRELIDAAEDTRSQLITLTERLTAHVATLQVYARAYARRQEGSP